MNRVVKLTAGAVGTDLATLRIPVK